jgi:hypothetical protein
MRAAGCARDYEMKNQDEKEHKTYSWVKDATGNEFLCPADVLEDADGAGGEELTDCISVEALKPYTEDL